MVSCIQVRPSDRDRPQAFLGIKVVAFLPRLREQPVFPQASFDTPNARVEGQEHLQIGYVLTPSIVTTWNAPKQATGVFGLQGLRAL